ncbi:MAG: cytochrome-c oxidase, cbb3-type subunit III, partial [Alphaproteobacteria bacterium]
VDEFTGTVTTGHEWDGIRELDTPMPRWWLWTFYATCIWALAYVFFYPAIPLINKSTTGLLGYSSRQNVDTEMAAVTESQAGMVQKISDMSLADIRADAELQRFAAAGGRSAFLVNCSQCHGSGAAGAEGYPNLNDDEWIWGGTLEAIETTIRHGIRFEVDDDTRLSQMPSFGADELLAGEEIAQAAEYVLKLAGIDHDATLAEPGAEIYTDNCEACHGADGGGDREQGAPALRDAIWLYGGNRELVTAQIMRPRHGVMPAWGSRLDPATIKQLAIYIHGLGGGQ